VRCIFVIDIFNGTVVHAVRGERERYEPIDRYSRVVSTSDPKEVVRVVRPKEVYIADLNQITGTGKGENLGAILAISCLARTMADIGVSNLSDLDHLPERVTPVLGTETASLKLIEEAALQREIVVSVDMKNRKVLSRDPELAALSPLDVLRRLNGFPLAGVILLELDRVGTSLGLDREFLEKASSVSDHPLILGGGVKGLEDLVALEKMGFCGALVATAVHNERIPLEMLR
jgi:phosphoribosylformimino-5-aminoimidazole carboxamide ribotide isomerase